jgi:Bacterial Ig-like domain (group 1)
LLKLSATHSFFWLKSAVAIVIVTSLVACGGGGSKSATPDTPPPPPTATSKVASLALQRTVGTIKSDDSNSSTITVTALDTNGAIIEGAIVLFTTGTGVLIPGSVTTDDSGKGAVSFSSGSTDISTRTATITASANGVSKQIPVLITGSTIDVTSPITSLPDSGLTTTTLTVQVKDAGGNSASGIPVTLSQAGGGGVGLSQTSGATDSNGLFVSTVSGLRPGSVTLSISAIGETRTLAYTITPTSTTSFNIDQQTLNGTLISNNDVTPMTIGSSLLVRVNAPGVANVVFATTQGTVNGATTTSVPVVGGKASATFTSATAGIASIQVLDPLNPTVSTDTLTVAVTSTVASAARISLQAAPNVVGISSGGTASTASLVATVTNANGDPVGGAAVAFQIVSGTGGGEQISPVVQLTNSTATAGLTLGQAKAVFTSGSLPSSQGGVKIRASVVGANVQTRDPTVIPPNPALCPTCGVDAAITIGGAPASISIGQPSDFTDSADKTQYIFPMSVFVSDASGRGVSGITVALSVFPVGWSTSIATGFPIGCSVDLDGFEQGTFLNEDADENFILDAVNEDGKRIYYDTGLAALEVGTPDNKITAPPADGGVLPATVTTDANGIASYNLIYPKSSAFHIIDRVRASTIVQGTETVGELRFRLPALKIDAPDDPAGCKLPPSPYIF